MKNETWYYRVYRRLFTNDWFVDWLAPGARYWTVGACPHPTREEAERWATSKHMVPFVEEKKDNDVIATHRLWEGVK